MQTMRKRTTAMRRTACGSALVLTLLVATGNGAVAQSDDGDWYDTKILRQVLRSIGLRRGEQPIDYRERSPLVVPPNRALPPPQSSAALKQNPAWPKDPDVERARALKKKGPKDTSFEEESRALLPGELNKGTVRGGRQRAVPPNQLGVNYTEPLLPSQLGSSGFLWFGKKKDVEAPFKGEPPRTTLTEPPVGYRTPSSAQPYGIVTSKNKSTKPKDYYTTHGEVTR